ncbi:drug/metabolite transporter superfamily [Russula emetica]|nr:drug/metabolite transporter superfamily [Russula emetica]
MSALLPDGRVFVSQRSLTERGQSAISSFLDKNAGLLLVASSQFFFSASNVCVKWLNSLDESERVPILELIWVRMAGTYVCCVAYMYWRKIPNPLLGPKGVRPLLLFRGYTGFTALSGMYFSLQYLSLSDAVALKFLTPILTGFSGAIFLRESFSIKEVIAGLCSFCGVILIARPQALFGGPQGIPSEEVVTSGQRMISVTAALIGVLGGTGSYTLLRAIGKRAHALHVLSFFASQCVLISTTGMIVFKVHPVIPTRGLWLLIMFLICIFGLIAQTHLAMGFQRETASRGSLAMYTSVVFAVVLEFIVFRTTPTPLSILGAIIIMTSAIYTSVLSSSLISTQLVFIFADS